MLASVSYADVLGELAPVTVISVLGAIAALAAAAYGAAKQSQF